MVLVVIAFWVAVGGLIGYAIGNGKGRGTEGFWLGLLLGFIGWIIVALMAPAPEHEAQRTAAIAAAVQAQSGSSKAGPTRDCPWCAESIKVAARVCRYCGRDVEPLAPQEVQREEVEFVRDEYPAVYEAALAHLERLPDPPARPAAWLRELCKRADAGSPLDIAATRIPLDWSGPEPQRPKVMPVPAGLGDPAAAGEYPGVLADHPVSYDRARALMAGLDQRPSHPDAWLRELCVRIDAGSPPESAAARIPLDWT